MSPIDGRSLSLTKNYQPEQLVKDLALMAAGATPPDQVRSILEAGNAAHGELFDDIVAYVPGPAFRAGVTQYVAEDELLRACRDSRAEALLLVWAALLLADPRLDSAVREVLTSADGKLRPEMVSRAAVEPALATAGLPHDAKTISNLLGLLRDVRLVEPLTRGGSIIGILRQLPTAFAVPGVLRLLTDRLGMRGVRPAGAEGMVDIALGLGVNHWLNLTPAEFRAAAAGTPAAAPALVRGSLPSDLQELHDELLRKKQVVLQGPPGVGKTYVARQYIRWLTADRPDECRVTTLLQSLPSQERTPTGVADLLERRGAPAVWDVVQFHPSYNYEDFVRSLQAQPVPGGVTFSPRHQLLSFLAALGGILEERASHVELLLLVDEINRGDISKIFGELIYALEYRDQPVATPYEVDGSSSIKLPARLYIIGTMNTADRSIALIDYALRRRFVFISVRPDRNIVRQHPYFASEKDRQVAVYLFDCIGRLFESEESLHDLQVGHSYFLHQDQELDEMASVALLARRFAYEIYPLLREYEAEGRFDRDKLAELMSRLGVLADWAALTQRELAAAVTTALAGQAGL